jgi:hypothetical protein
MAVFTVSCCYDIGMADRRVPARSLRSLAEPPGGSQGLEGMES